MRYAAIAPTAAGATADPAWEERVDHHGESLDLEGGMSYPRPACAERLGIER
jgi:hypothetical protein